MGDVVAAGSGASGMPIPIPAVGALPPPTPHPVPKPTARNRNGVLEIPTANGEILKLDGEFEEMTSGGETVTRKIKEHDKVVSPNFPSITNVNAWHNQQARNLVLTSR